MNQNDNKFEKLKGAYDDLAVIKQTMACSTFSLGKVSGLFLVSGGMMLIYYLMELFTVITKIGFGNIFTIVFLLATAVGLGYYIYKRRRMVEEDDLYSIHLLDLWGFAIFMPQILMSVVRFVRLFDSRVGVVFNELAIAALYFSAVFLFCAACFFSGVLTKSNLLKLIAMILFVAEFMLITWTSYGDAVNYYRVSIRSVNDTTLAFYTLFYLGMGLTLHPKKKNGGKIA